MISILKRWSTETRLEQERGAAPCRTPESVLEFLTPGLIDTLASLHGVPPAVAQATVQLLPFGSRSALETLGLAFGGDPSGRPGRRYLELTPLAFEVMALAADSQEGGPETLESLSEQAEEALEAVERERGGNL